MPSVVSARVFRTGFLWTFWGDCANASFRMVELGVNVDHIATIRQARRTVEPDPVAGAVLAELGGADSITVHLREDRRHIQDPMCVS